MLQDLFRAGSDLRICGEKEHPNVEEIDVIVSHDCLERNRWRDRRMVVFIRDPLEAIASWYKLDELSNAGKTDSLNLFRAFAFDRAIPYWVQFVQEYCFSSQVDQRVHVYGYKGFVSNPKRGLGWVSRDLGINIDVGKALTTVPVVVRTNHSLFKHYEDHVLIIEMKRALGPYPLMLQMKGII